MYTTQTAICIAIWQDTESLNQRTSLFALCSLWVFWPTPEVLHTSFTRQDTRHIVLLKVTSI